MLIIIIPLFLYILMIICYLVMTIWKKTSIKLYILIFMSLNLYLSYLTSISKELISIGSCR